MENKDIEDFIENLVKNESDHSKLNKNAIERLMDMRPRERLDYVNSMGNIPLDNEGRQLISCPQKDNAVCALYPIYEGGSATTVCSGPMVMKKTKSNSAITKVMTFGTVRKRDYYESAKADEECPYHPRNAKSPSSDQFQDNQDDDLMDLFD